MAPSRNKSNKIEIPESLKSDKRIIELSKMIRGRVHSKNSPINVDKKIGEERRLFGLVKSKRGESANGICSQLTAVT